MTRRDVLATLAVCSAVLFTGTCATALASNASATSEYLAADYAMVHTARSYLARAEAAPLLVLAQVKRECPQAAAGSPQNPESTEMSYEVIGAMVLHAYHLDVPGLRSFLARVAHLHWSNAGLTNAVRGYAAKIRVLAGLAPPNLCGDIHAWDASGYRTLPPATVHFDALFTPNWVAIGEQPSGLRAYESSADRAVAARSSALESELTEGEARAVESYSKIMNELEVLP